jgi:hypothetical protein
MTKEPKSPKCGTMHRWAGATAGCSNAVELPPSCDRSEYETLLATAGDGTVGGAMRAVRTIFGLKTCRQQSNGLICQLLLIGHLLVQICGRDGLVSYLVAATGLSWRAGHRVSETGRRGERIKRVD